MPNIYVYILIMSVVTYSVRLLPLTLLRKPIKNIFIQSFLHYVPYVTLAVMTFPAILEVTQVPLAGLLALLAGSLAAWYRGNLFQVAIVCCATVLIVEALLI
ncbi:AzlD domain-containing protein [Candidatus Enterococcus ferrettii]|uniref:Branched-chain amino acid transporter n=1 Tax=Candidatus Enterococcus ferrettii TaxID=2815324 RepID=A0ABV0ELR9_9ENTE|nr:AzlD domain-containing protein [Enterococcus sp. 665A]MBO1340120.1 AzlD domain-containing protein [Enterococcus sp. 665A]